MFDTFIDWAVVALPTIAGFAWPYIDKRMGEHPMGTRSQRVVFALLGLGLSGLIFFQQHRTRTSHDTEVQSLNRRLDTLQTTLNGVQKDSERPINVGPISVPDKPSTASAYWSNIGLMQGSRFVLDKDQPIRLEISVNGPAAARDVQIRVKFSSASPLLTPTQEEELWNNAIASRSDWSNPETIPSGKPYVISLSIPVADTNQTVNDPGKYVYVMGLMKYRDDGGSYTREMCRRIQQTATTNTAVACSKHNQ
jgi:hypothetical protein